MSAASTVLPAAGAPARTSRATGRLYLVRAVVALVWAALLAVALSPGGVLTAGSTLPVLAVVLLVLYPLVDVGASLVDARTQRSSGNPGAARAQWVNAAVSAVAAGAVLVATTTGGPASVLRVFGAWAVLTGVVQLALAISRARRGVRGQWPMIISGGLSTVLGLAFSAMASRTELSLLGLAGYAVGGAVLYLVSAVRLHRSTVG